MNIIKSLFQSSIGKKYMMAATGLLLFLFVIVHLVGNLQIYLGPDAINAYAALLHRSPAMIWVARLGLLAIAVIHISTAIILELQNRAARPVAYAAWQPPYASLASRTMILSGFILFSFILYHILHFTAGLTDPEIMHFTDAEGRHDVYRMVVQGFSHQWAAMFYVVSVGLLFLHLSHGIGSFFQSMGWKNRKCGAVIEKFSQWAAFIIFLGNCSIPLVVQTGLLK